MTSNGRVERRHCGVLRRRNVTLKGIGKRCATPLESPPFMTRVHKPLEILVYQDVLCAWCYIADLRLEALRKEFTGWVSFRQRSFPLRVEDTLPSEREVRGWVEEIERARQEPEGVRLSPALWTQGDPPRSSLSALAALEAARLQGPEKRDALARALQRAALELGVNVTRSDVVFELASALKLDMNRFTAAYEAPQTRRLLREEHTLASTRGVKSAPTIVLGGRWMVSGLKEIPEYREHILACLEKTAAGNEPFASERIIH